MTPEHFLQLLQHQTSSFAQTVSTNEGEWIIKGFIDIHKKVYTISIDTKIISKILELLLFPIFDNFARCNQLKIELVSQQNFYPDLTFIHEPRQRNSCKNIKYPYQEYSGHYVLGVIYTKCDLVADERKSFRLEDIEKIPSVIKDFQFFAQPKYKIASSSPGSGNTKNIGSVTKISELIEGKGIFSLLGEEVYDDYWMYYLTTDMAKQVDSSRPYTNLKSYLEYKQRGSDALKLREDEIINLSSDYQEITVNEESV